MSRRKLRFDTRKNHERKRKREDDCTADTSLILQIPHSIYRASSAKSLYTMLTRSQSSIPREWAVQFITANNCLALQKMRYNQWKKRVEAIFTITIMEDLEYTISVGSMTVDCSILTELEAWKVSQFCY